MNWYHRQICQSGRWRRRLEEELLPWALQGVELGDDVLELGPGLTTDLLRGRTKRLTALEVETNAAACSTRSRSARLIVSCPLTATVRVSFEFIKRMYALAHDAPGQTFQPSLES